MRFRNAVLMVLCALVLGAGLPLSARPVFGQQQGAQQMSPMQRIEVMRSRLETMRRTLNSAIAGMNAKDPAAKEVAVDDPRTRLSGLEKEVGSLLSEVNDVRAKQERADRYDPSILDKLEASIPDLDTRVQAAMRETASERRTSATASSAASNGEKKKKGGFFSRLLGRGGGDDKYDELVGTVAPGRDRELFQEATKEARDDNYETARALFGVVINTYPDSEYLPLAKLAIADTFYLEGTTSALIQAGQQYQDWVTFFPTHPLADDVMLKMAEVEMRRMGLPDRENAPARKAEQRLKAFMQQFPQSSLRPDAEIKLREVQENLAMHNLQVGNHYYERYYRGVATNLKGAQSRYREVAEKYPFFSRMDAVLYRLGSTYMAEEEPDEAAKYFQRLVRYHPNSEFAEKAKEQLASIGAVIPDPDPKALNEPPPTGPSFLEGVMREITGVVPKTVDKAGVIIGTSSKGGDLIQAAIENGGTLPDSYHTTPTARTAPARRLAPAPTPVTPEPKPTEKKDVSIEPTRPGPPRSGSDPAQPAATQPVTPATPPPTSGAKP
ncbi:MAG TPA: outer membrane protein assembly factor BamD [Pyrinomonadaceae bacterium]|nr:outer membrane protein assembly factor BamD [Pyrinomonadaceae bacterium]